MREIPDRLKGRPRDSRGYVIPYIVMMDSNGKPYFAVNDYRRVEYCYHDDRCGICGQKLLRGRWFVGSAVAAYHPNGAYLDPPMHLECMEYSLSVCPYLAAAKYLRPVGMQTLKQLPDGDLVAVVETAPPDERPDMFVAVMSRGHTRIPEGYFVPEKPYIAKRYYRHGAKVDDVVGSVHSVKQVRMVLDQEGRLNELEAAAALIAK